MLPTMPDGHCGAPRKPGTIGTGGRPSRASASRAHARTVLNSRRRLSTALPRAASSAGNSTASGTSPNASTAATAGGRIYSNITPFPGPGVSDAAARAQPPAAATPRGSPTRPPPSARQRARSSVGYADDRKPPPRRGTGHASQPSPWYRTIARTPGTAAPAWARGPAENGSPESSEPLGPAPQADVRSSRPSPGTTPPGSDTGRDAASPRRHPPPPPRALARARPPGSPHPQGGTCSHTARTAARSYPGPLRRPTPERGPPG